MNIVPEPTALRILAILHEQGPILLEELLLCLPDSTWNQVFMSVDTLSRQGAIRLQRRGFDYALRISSPSAAGPMKCPITTSTAQGSHFSDAA